MAGKLGSILAEDGEVLEVLLVVDVRHHGGTLDGINHQLGFDPEQEKVIKVGTVKFLNVFCLYAAQYIAVQTNEDNEFTLDW